jgi:hypothetical protein
MAGMRWFSRRKGSAAELLAVSLPRPDGSGWPDRAAVGQPSFESNTFYELGLRSAYEPEAHAISARLVDDVLPYVPTGVSAEDEPYLTKVFATAARIGAGVGIVERGLGAADPAVVDRRIGAALWEGRRKLPVMSPEWATTAGYFLLAGFHVARSGPDGVDRLVEELRTG